MPGGAAVPDTREGVMMSSNRGFGRGGGWRRHGRRLGRGGGPGRQGAAVVRSVEAQPVRPRVERDTMVALIDEDRCIRCGICVDVCIDGAIGIEGYSGAIAVEPARCSGCAACLAECPADAISLHRLQLRPA